MKRCLNNFLFLGGAVSCLVASCVLAGESELICPEPASPAVMRPELHCAFIIPPPGDPYPLHTDVLGSPLVFNGISPSGGPARESLVAAVFSARAASSWREDDGVLRILRAADCSVVATLGGGERSLVSTFSPAAADLNQNSDPEIVTAGANGSTYAWTAIDGAWSALPLWEAPLAGGSGWDACNTTTGRCTVSWGGFAIHDLDDDGEPEVIRAGTVWAANGALRSLPPSGYGQQALGDNSLVVGHFPMLANLDDDALIELTDGFNMWEWIALPIPGWAAQSGFSSDATGAGHVGIGDLFSPEAEEAAQPELVLVQNATVHVLEVDGSSLDAWPFAAGGGETAPVLADIDGDGLLEAGVNNQLAFTVFDADCTESPRAGGSCSQGLCDALGESCPDGVAWSRPIQDLASGRTPAVAFDFEGDGASELVFADECFTRGFDSTGRVIFSRYRSSCTFQESPVVAAIDATGRAALVVPNNTACGPADTGLTCPVRDPIFRGQACVVNEDCDSGSCNSGLCRCSSSAQCCSSGSDGACEAEGYTCTAPLAGSPGTGNTCQASRPGALSGISIHTDSRWTRARPIWNQPGFAVTHINDDGIVPISSEWLPNWLAASDGYRSMPSLGPYCLPQIIFDNGFETQL